MNITIKITTQKTYKIKSAQELWNLLQTLKSKDIALSIEQTAQIASHDA